MRLLFVKIFSCFEQAIESKREDREKKNQHGVRNM